MVNILNDIQSEVDIFFDDLNWTFILIYVFILYGIKHKEEFLWYNKIFDFSDRWRPFKVWVAGIIVMILFCIFSGLEVGLTSIYVSQLMRSWIIVVVFNSVFSNKISKIDKEL